MKQKILVVLMFLVFITACQEQILEDKPKSKKYINNLSIVQITPEICEKYGGEWDECGSPCAGTNAEICIQMCQAQCECGGIAGFKCPQGYKCKLSGKIADEIGVCVR